MTGMPGLLLIILAFLVFLVFAWFALSWLARRLASRSIGTALSYKKRGIPLKHTLTTKDIIECENSIRTSLIQILGGSAVFATLLFGWLTLRATNTNIDETRAQNYSVRYVTALELLARSGRTERLGGIYALESLATAPETIRDYAWPALETLSVFARDSVRKSDGGQKLAPDAEQVGPCEEFDLPEQARTGRFLEHETHASIRSIGQILRASNQYGYIASFRGVDLSRSALCKVYAPDGFFRHVYFGQTSLRGAILNRADLSQANFLGADLREAHIKEAVFTFANLQRVTLTNSQIEVTDFRDANFCRADLRHVDFKQARLSNAVFTCANLRGANLSAARGMGRDQFRDACVDESTIIKDGIKINYDPSCVERCQTFECSPMAPSGEAENVGNRVIRALGEAG